MIGTVLSFCSPIQGYRLHSSRTRLVSAACVCRTKMTTAVQTNDEERFDILMEDGSPKGFSKPRSQVHRDGDWHRSTHIWVVTCDGRVLVQKRAVGKDTFPGRWDVSAAGHITAGSTSAPSARRELEEELGVKLTNENELQFVMSVKASAAGRTDLHGEYLDNEIQDIYIYNPEKTISLETFTLQEEEVESIEYWKWDYYCERCNNGDELLVPRSPTYRSQFFPWLQQFIQNKP